MESQKEQERKPLKPVGQLTYKKQKIGFVEITTTKIEFCFYVDCFLVTWNSLAATNIRDISLTRGVLKSTVSLKEYILSC